jgi:hypothetical protein
MACSVLTHPCPTAAAQSGPEAGSHDQDALVADLLVLRLLFWSSRSATQVRKVNQGRKTAEESRKYREVVTAIRFLAKANRSRWAVNRKIAILLAASRETTIIRAIFIEAGLSDHILINLLPSAGQGNKMAIERILEIARITAPRIRIRRGPKVTAGSAAHELFLEKHGIRGARAYSYSELEKDFIDEGTRATRLEFPGARFGPQPASRRVNLRRCGSLTQARRASEKKSALDHLIWRNMAISVLESVDRLDLS